jgi:phage FluMu protein Com
MFSQPSSEICLYIIRYSECAKLVDTPDPYLFINCYWFKIKSPKCESINISPITLEGINRITKQSTAYINFKFQ